MKNPLVINLTGTCGKTTTAKIIERILTLCSYKVGLASSVGIYIHGKRIYKHDRTGPTSFRYLYKKSPSLDVIICENVLRHIKKGNFYPDLANSCLITNISDDHKHQTVSNSLQEIADIKSKLITRCEKDSVVVLNGDNPYTQKMAPKVAKKNLVFFTMKKESLPHLKKYVPAAVYFFDTPAIKKNVRGKTSLIIKDLTRIPLTLKLQLTFNTSNILASVAVLDSLKQISITSAQMEKALSKIQLDYADLPGRFNLIPFADFTVILDDAHNPDSYKAAFQTAKRIPHKRLVSVIKASSTRKKEFIQELGKIAAYYSDFIYVKESFGKKSKNRKKYCGKIAQFLQEGILKANFEKKNICLILDEQEAVRTAIENARTGDLILIFGYRIDDLWSLITKLRSSLSL